MIPGRWVKRRSSSINTNRIDHILEKDKNFILHYGDVTDAIMIMNLINQIKPNEIYNLSAQSHVAVSFQLPEYTANVDALGSLRILEAIKSCNLTKKTKFYQAGTSEMFGKVQEIPQSEKTNFYPRSPYGVSKVFSHWMTINYREAYGMFACNGILFNHESPRRGETFVTRKITRFLARKKVGLEKTLYLGNLNAKRDWGHAKDYVEMQWRILQQKKPKDYVIATGETYSVREFITLAGKYLGMKIFWRGKGLKEFGYTINKGKKYILIKIDKKYFRPNEVNYLKGNPNMAYRELRFRPKYSFKDLVKDMVFSDLKKAQKEII